VEGLESGRSERVWCSRARVAARTHAVWPAWLSTARECVRRTAGRGVLEYASHQGVLVRWKTVWVCALLLAGTLGCPHAFGRGGTIDRAMHKDLMERLKNSRCTDPEIRRYCGVGMNIEDCLDLCE
jgi:hypothetical protein